MRLFVDLIRCVLLVLGLVGMDRGGEGRGPPRAQGIPAPLQA
jgi:hypothetical protein